MCIRDRYNASVDTFSYGILMIHVLSGELPEPQVAPTRIAKGGKLVAITEAVRREKFLQAIGEDHILMTLIQKCIDNNPQGRPQTGEIVKRLTEMVLQLPSSQYDNRLEMLRCIESDKEEKWSLREKTGELSLEVEQLRLQVEDVNTDLSGLKSIISILRKELADKDAIISAKNDIISAKDDIISATDATILRKESEIEVQTAILQKKDATISEMCEQLTRNREHLAATKQQVCECTQLHGTYKFRLKN